MIEQTDLRVDGKVALPQTPSQTVGPFFAYALTPEQYGYEFNDLINNQIINNGKNAIKIIGQVFDGEGNAIPDAIIELYSPEIAMNTCARCGTGTDLEGKFSFHTNKTLYFNVIVFMRGQLIHSYTRLYFDDQLPLNEHDETYQSVPLERRSTLLAMKKNDYYEYNIYMQGDHETVFFDI